MDAFSEEQFENHVAPILQSIFVNEDAYGQPFVQSVVERRLLYPVSSIFAKTMIPLMDAIILSAHEVGDTDCYLSIIGRPPPLEQTQPFHWKFQLNEIKEYRSQTLNQRSSLDHVYSLEHILYSPRGYWGIMISDEGHGLIGGNQQFFNTMHKIIPEFDDIKQVSEFLLLWKYYATNRGADIKWIPPLLSHIYSEEMAQDLLNQSSFTDLF